MSIERSTGPVTGWASLARPPIDRVPAGRGRPDPLTEFVRSGTRPWGGVPVPFSTATVATLWTVLGLNLGLGGWLLAVRAGTAECSGLLCWAVTLGDHPWTTLVLTEVCAGALVVSVPMTRGLSRASGPQLALIVTGVLTGVVALAGVLGTLAAAALAFVLALGSFAVVAERL